MRFATVVALSCLLLARSAPAGSRRCGDDVDGRGTAVPCDCGDVLVSSRTLGDRDPITQHACDGTGLVVDLRGDAPAELSLAGRALEGSGQGIGIQVTGGGGGLHLKGPGAVRAFGVGIQALTGALVAASDVLAAENHGDGFQVAGAGYVITRCEAVRNGHDGFQLRGRAFRVEGNRALENGRRGFVIAGRDAVVGGAAGNEAAGNGRDGLAVHGSGHAVEGAQATANGGPGMRAHVVEGKIKALVAVGNRGKGLRAAGRDLLVSDSQAQENRRGGIDAHGTTVRDGGGNRARDCRVGRPCK